LAEAAAEAVVAVLPGGSVPLAIWEHERVRIVGLGGEVFGDEFDHERRLGRSPPLVVVEANAGLNPGSTAFKLRRLSINGESIGFDNRVIAGIPL
jgi:hypothetical protein